MKQRFSSRTIVFFLTFFSLFFVSTSLFSVESNLQEDISEIVTSVGVSPKRSALIITCLEDGRRWVSGKDRLEFPYPPASTAKIPHTLIALEEGYAKGSESLFEWDGEERFLPVWNQDHSLQSAYKYSVGWVYQRITQDLGPEIMFSWIDRLQYGNKYIGCPEDISSYWLNGPLEISAEQQITFLKALALENLPLSASIYENAKAIMMEDCGNNWSYNHKSPPKNSAA
jgi:beta-lactamase class D